MKKKIKTAKNRVEVWPNIEWRGCEGGILSPQSQQQRREPSTMFTMIKAMKKFIVDFLASNLNGEVKLPLYQYSRYN